MLIYKLSVIRLFIFFNSKYEPSIPLLQHLWEPEPDLRIQILDFGGHHIYSAAHHMFLTPEALHILVFDLSAYKTDQYDALIGDWLDSIMDRAPGNDDLLNGSPLASYSTTLAHTNSCL